MGWVAELGRSAKEGTAVPPGYFCMICKGTVPFAGPQEHPLDPCALVIVGHADKELRDQKEQTFYCHFECFRRLLGDDGVLYIKDADFATNGEAADEQSHAEQAAAGDGIPSSGIAAPGQ